MRYRVPCVLGFPIRRNRGGQVDVNLGRHGETAPLVPGILTGPGGKMDERDGGSYLDAMRRELKQEIGFCPPLNAQTTLYAGQVLVDFVRMPEVEETPPPLKIEVFLFDCADTILWTPEYRDPWWHHWHPQRTLPLHRLTPGDGAWVPQALNVALGAVPRRVWLVRGADFSFRNITYGGEATPPEEIS